MKDKCKKVELTLSHMCGRGQLSLCSNFFQTSFKDSTLLKLQAWKRDFHEDIQEAEWESAGSKAQSQSVNTKSRLLQSKWLMGTSLTASRLSHMFPNIPDFCVKCGRKKVL